MVGGGPTGTEWGHQAGAGPERETGEWRGQVKEAEWTAETRGMQIAGRNIAENAAMPKRGIMVFDVGAAEEWGWGNAGEFGGGVVVGET